MGIDCKQKTIKKLHTIQKVNMNRSCTLCLVVCRADYHCFQIELSKNYGVPEWREDVKTCLLKAGLQNLPVVFLFTDTQVCANDR